MSTDTNTNSERQVFFQTLKYITPGNASPQGRQRVYFCCHPEDFEHTFEPITNDLFKIRRNIAVYYRDPEQPFPEDELFLQDLSQMQLFVIPITWRFLYQDDPARTVEMEFALKKHIPILPLMQESELKSDFNQICGSRQYLDKNQDINDLTALPYEEKLKKFLNAVLVGDELAARVRAAFDAYVFLSYRKKDREYANKIMRLIHSNEFYQDVAIWYDEFLTPGENYNDEIAAAIRTSRLMALVVTPSLLESPNYIQKIEYPAARQMKKEVLPIMAKDTDEKQLVEMYEGIRSSVSVDDPETVTKLLHEMLTGIALRENDNDPAHLFLIGLAYLGGIDVEVDHARALRLITSASDAGLPEACGKLVSMYKNGEGVEAHYPTAVEKQREYVDLLRNHSDFGEEHPDTLTALGDLAEMLSQTGKYQEALAIQTQVYKTRKRIFGEEHPDTLNVLGNYAVTLGKMGRHKESLEKKEQLYEIRKRVSGEESTGTLIVLGNLAVTLNSLGRHQEALELQEKLYEIRKRISGEEGLGTLITLGNLAFTLGKLGRHEEALKIQEQVYETRRKVFGEDRPGTRNALNNLACTLRTLGRYEEALEKHEQVYEARKRFLTEEHPGTLISLQNLAITLGCLGRYQESLEMLERCYQLRVEVLGENRKRTLKTLFYIGKTLHCLDKDSEALEKLETCYAIQKQVLREGDPDILATEKLLEEIRSNSNR